MSRKKILHKILSVFLIVMLLVTDIPVKAVENTDAAVAAANTQVVETVPEEAEPETVPEETTPETVPEETNVEESEEDYEGLMTPEELAALSEEEVGATIWKDGVSLFRMASGSNWTFDTYYVKEDSFYATTKTNDFHLKYQMEFHASQNLESQTVEIRIPKKLLTDRNGKEIVPASIAVPKGTKDAPIETKNSFFNYYEEEEALVFFNYKSITSGTNAAFQVLYKNLKIMDIVDMTKWSLQPQISVLLNGETETSQTEPLTGVVDSKAVLSSVSKTPYNMPGDKNYTPGLYTKEQVKRFISAERLPEEYETNFDAYRYVVWDVKVRGGGTQPFKLAMTDSPQTSSGTAGRIVGIRSNYSSVYKVMINGSGTFNAGEKKEILPNCSEESWGCEFFVVTAYPKEQAPEGELLKNDIAITLTPSDGMDTEQTRNASAQWSCTDYHWDYDGYIIRIKKGDNQKHPSWLEIFRNAKENREDRGQFLFETETLCNGYSYTHDIIGPQMGQYQTGAYYTITSVDDTVYAYSSLHGQEEGKRLSGRDYYFSSVEILQTDFGYDIWEDEFAAPENPDPVKIDQKLEIYAMYADTYPEGEDPARWEFVADVEWNDSGELVYRFTPEQIARKPWRVKAVHNSVNFRTVCNIKVQVNLRHDSPIMAALLEENPEAITIENISGVMGERFENYTSKGYFHPQGIEKDFNYQEPGLEEYTRTFYGDAALLMRYNAFAELTALKTRAAAYKSAKTSNDAVNERVLIDYCLTAHDGYLVGSADDVKYLQDNDVLPPGRKAVVFYDLLPLGMNFDPSVPVSAGRIRTIDSNGKYQDTPKSWDTSDVQVTVDTERDIIENYRNTGRTMVVFHVTYNGADSSSISADGNAVYWFEGWGVSFRAYYDWKDMDTIQTMANISAFMPEKGDTRALLGTDQEVACDDGVIVPADLAKDCKAFGSDINEDKTIDVKNVLYARAAAQEDMAVSSVSGIQKLVRADEDKFGAYARAAEASPSGGYTYDITVSNNSERPVSSIVIYDRLENAAEDRKGVEGEPEFDPSWWHGEFQSLILNGLVERGISPKVYYNENRGAKISEAGENPAAVLTEANGWLTAEAWEVSGKTPEQVRAVAVDISLRSDGTEFALNNTESVSFQIKMKAPGEVAENVIHTYNNPAFYSKTGTGESATVQTVIGNSVMVTLSDNKVLEIEKSFGGETPETVRDSEFEFYVFRERSWGKQKFANQEYQLWKKNAEGQWEQTEGLHATDAEGRLSLHEGEKAVFLKVRDLSSIHVEEEENPFWVVEYITELSADGTRKSIRTVNTYRPILFAQKELQAIPNTFTSVKREELENKKFRFQMLADGQPLKNSEFWYVDSVRTDGGIPAKVTASGENGIGRTDDQGMFEICAKDIIALFPGKAGTQYTLREISDPDDDWLCKEESVSGSLSVLGTAAGITNIYRWKDLYLTKNLTHQEPKDCTQSFTFKLTDSSGAPLHGNRWVLLENGAETTTEGTLDENGTFSCACGGKTVKIEGLEAEQTYTVEETESGTYYEKVNNGITEVTMPLYSSKKDAEITNEYLKRSLSVSKQVLYDLKDTAEAAKVAAKEFTMTVTINGEPLKNFAYSIAENGKPVTGEFKTNESGEFSLKHQQTAVFQNAGIKGDSFKVTETGDPEYLQIYPANGASHTGTLLDDAELKFINGSASGLMISKEYVGGNEKGTEYLSLMRDTTSLDGRLLREYASVSFSLEVQGENATRKYPAPIESWEIYSVVDQLTGTVKPKRFENEVFKIKPWEIVIISEDMLPQGAVSYTLAETSADQHRVFEWQDGFWLEIQQKEPANDAALSGTLEENRVLKIVNEISVVQTTGSEIEKRMTAGSEKPPVGAELVWKLEQYDGTSWVPAQDVAYLTLVEIGVTSDRILKTGEDGLITLTMSENGYPKVKFIEAAVKLNVYEGMRPGDLRLVEVPELSDERWGILAGYGSAENPYTYSLNLSSEKAAAFVNSNRNALVEIEKKMEQPSNETFTMILRQVLSARGQIQAPDDIFDSEPGTNLSYTLYDKLTGKPVRDGITDSRGGIRLKAGQYARLELPDGSLWTVSEEQRQDHKLKEMTGTANRTTPLGENLMLLQAKAEKTATLGIQVNGRVGVREKLNKGLFTVTVVDSDQTQRILEPEEFTISPEYAKDEVGVMDVTVNYAAENLSGTAKLEVVGNTSIAKEDVEDGVIDASTKERVMLDQENVVIPPYIIRADGKTYKVTGINSLSFGDFSEYNWTLTSITIPEGVTRIERLAFYECSRLTSINIPSSVTSIGSLAFYGCSSLTSINLPAEVTSIGDSAFDGCSDLMSITINKPKDSITGSPWGWSKGANAVTWTGGTN